MSIDLQKLQQKFDALFQDEKTVAEFEQLVEVRKLKTANTMTPKEKAQKLFIAHYHAISGISLSSVAVIYKHLKRDSLDYKEAKQCALITVVEVMNGNFSDGYDHYYWEQVKYEIEKL